MTSLPRRSAAPASGGQGWSAAGPSLDHQIRGQLTVAVGEIELVLAEPDVPADVRAASAARALAALWRVEHLLGISAQGAAP